VNLFNWTAYKVDHAHSIHSLHMKSHFRCYLWWTPADGYQRVSALISCTHAHLHESGSFFQCWPQF